MTYCYAFKDTVLNKRAIKLLVFKVLRGCFFFPLPLDDLMTGLPPETALLKDTMHGWGDGVRGTHCLWGAADRRLSSEGCLGGGSGFTSPPYSWSKRFCLAVKCTHELLGWPWKPLPKELFFTQGSLSKPAMGCIELILLTAKGIPCCRIIFPVSVNHFTTAFPDSYASDLLISMYFLLYLWHC